MACFPCKTSITAQFIIVPGSSHSPVRFNRSLSRRSRITCQKMSCSTESVVPTLRTVTISYSELKARFGPDGLGILSVTDVPGFSSLRQNLLHLAPRLASLPEEVKKDLEDHRSRYNFGWSHGKEKLESGKPGRHVEGFLLCKSSIGCTYNRAIFDTTVNVLRKTSSAASIFSSSEVYPSYCGSNIWPDSALPELEVVADVCGWHSVPHNYFICLLNFKFFPFLAFKSLGKLILDVGLRVAFHCDQYGKSPLHEIVAFIYGGYQ
ncbi:hypothetical protein Patl1_13189 [Pistacia atlantica]|uniref:Uncharacterized protein n=1 Tax=Pistacia atlantica TaxID=434234 RepID=A0ACC1AS46_9ROSI|nr:hypothetical protein Patl1_13189 [Pistacia atlantica]